MKNRTILQGDCLQKLRNIPDGMIDQIVTDPPYGYSFMNKDWDKAVVRKEVWTECLRVLKSGSFAFVMSAPRQDVLSHMITNLTDAGFVMGFTSMYWTYASGFPKAMNISKAVDKRNGRDSQPYKDLGEYIKSSRLTLKIPQSEISKNFLSKTGGLTGCMSNWELGMNVPTKQQWKILKQKLNLDNRFDELIEREEAQREVIGKKVKAELKNHVYFGDLERAKQTGHTIGYGEFDVTKSETPQAKRLDGSYAGFQPKPAVEVILVCMKPLSEKNYVEQALSNQKGVTWFDDCRIPYLSKKDIGDPDRGKGYPLLDEKKGWNQNSLKNNITIGEKGRFPANLIVSDNSLDVGKKTKSTRTKTSNGFGVGKNTFGIKDDSQTVDYERGFDDEGDFSRYFSLDSWEAQFIITPKPSKSEKNKGLDNFTAKQVNDGRNIPPDNAFQRGKTQRQNTHPTVKPVSLFKYLVTLGSRENDYILDPFMGSGTTAIACEQISRNWIGIELNKEYCEIIMARIDDYKKQTRLFN